MKKILFLGSSSQISQSFKGSSFFNYYKKNLKFLEFKHFENFEKVIHQFNPDIVINTFVFHPVDLCEKYKKLSYIGNVKIVKDIVNVLNNFDLKKILLVHFSSDYVYNKKNKNLFCSELDKTSPTNTLGKHKVLAENYIEKNYSKYFIIRISWLFSCYNKNFVKTMINLIKEKKEINVINNQFGNPTSSFLISKILNKIFKISDKNMISGTYNVCGSPNVSWYTFAMNINEILLKKGHQTKIKPISSSQFYGQKKMKIKRPYNSSMNISKAIKYFKIPKTDLDWKKDLIKIIKML